MSSSDNTNKTSPETNEKFHATCEKALLRVITKNPKIHTLLDSIEALGCQLPKDFFACRYPFKFSSLVHCFDKTR